MPLEAGLDCTECPWLDHDQNPNFSQNLLNVIVLQKRIKHRNYKRCLIVQYYLKKKLCHDVVYLILSFL